MAEVYRGFNSVPILTNEQIEYAVGYYSSILERPSPLDIDDFMEFYLGLEVEAHFHYHNGMSFGVTIFEDTDFFPVHNLLKNYVNHNPADVFGGYVLVDDYSEKDHEDITPYSYYLNGPIFRALLPSQITFMVLQMVRIHRDSGTKDKALSLCINRGGFLYKLFIVSADSDTPLSLMFKQLVTEIEDSLQDFISNGDYAQVMKLYIEGDNLDKSYSENRILSEDD